MVSISSQLRCARAMLRMLKMTLRGIRTAQVRIAVTMKLEKETSAAECKSSRFSTHMSRHMLRKRRKATASSPIVCIRDSSFVKRTGLTLRASVSGNPSRDPHALDSPREE